MSSLRVPSFFFICIITTLLSPCPSAGRRGKASPCRARELPLHYLGARCSTNSQMLSFPCELALDGVEHTLWSPRLSDAQHTAPFIVVSLAVAVSLARVDLLQYDAGLGRANRVSLTFDEGDPYRVRLRPRDGGGQRQYYDRISLPPGVVAKEVRIRVEGVDLLAFGGFKEVRLVGCYDRKVARSRLRNRAKSGQEDLQQRSTDSLTTSSWYSSEAAYGSLAGLAVGGAVALFLAVVLVYVVVANRCERGRHDDGFGAEEGGEYGSSFSEEEEERDDDGGEEENSYAEESVSEYDTRDL